MNIFQQIELNQILKNVSNLNKNSKPGKKYYWQHKFETIIPQYHNFVTMSVFILHLVTWLQTLFVQPFFPYLEVYNTAQQLVVLKYVCDVLARVLSYCTEVSLVGNKATLPLWWCFFDFDKNFVLPFFNFWFWYSQKTFCQHFS